MSRAAIAMLIGALAVVGVHASRAGVARGAAPGLVTLNLWPAGQGSIAVVQNGAPVGLPCDILSLVASSAPCRVDVVPGVPVTLTATAMSKADVDLEIAADPDAVNLRTQFDTDLPDFTFNLQPTFVRWTVFGCVGTGPCTFTPVDDDDYVGAIFSPLQLEVGVDGSGSVAAQHPGGTVEGLPCDPGPGFGDTTCHGLFAADETVTLLATGQPLSWNPDCEPVPGGPVSTSCSVVMNNLRTFASLSYVPPVNPGDPPPEPPPFPFQIQTRVRVQLGGTGHGRVTGSGFDCGAACTTLPLYQDPVMLQATADPGSQFVGWRGVCSTNPTCTFSAGSATQVQAVFDVPVAPVPPVAVIKAPTTIVETTIAARLGKVSLTHRAGHRVLELPLFVDRAAAASVRLTRGGRTLVLWRRTLHPGRNLLRLQIPKKIKQGRGQLRVRVLAGDQVRILPISLAIGR